MKNNLTILGLLVIAFGFSHCKQGSDSTQSTSLMDLGSAESDTEMNLDSGAYYGIDISHFQGDLLEELSVKDSLHFVICKATGGISYLDPDFHKNWEVVKSKGLIRGAYHFYYFVDDPIKQADHFISTVGVITKGDIAPIVDVEQGGLAPSISTEQMQRDLKVFLDYVESKLGRKPIIYTDTSFADQYLTDAEFAKYKLWLAEYTKDDPRIPVTWKTKGYFVWQKSESYALDCTTSDLDVFFGELNDLVKE